jgi:hypothetical protein
MSSVAFDDALATEASERLDRPSEVTPMGSAHRGDTMKPPSDPEVPDVALVGDLS